MKFTCPVVPSMEGNYYYERTFPNFPAMFDIHKEIMKKKPVRKYILVLLERSCSNSPYSIYVEKGLLSKKYEYDGELSISNEAFFALRQYYYDIHAAFPAKIFNVLDIWVDASNPDKPKIQARVMYDQNFDGAVDGVQNNSGTYPSKAISNRNYMPMHEFISKGETQAGFKPLKA